MCKVQLEVTLLITGVEMNREMIKENNRFPEGKKKSLRKEKNSGILTIGTKQFFAQHDTERMHVMPL